MTAFTFSSRQKSFLERTVASLNDQVWFDKKNQFFNLWLVVFSKKKNNLKMRRRDEILRQECRRKTKENAFLLGEIDLLKKELHEARSSSTGAGRSQKRDVSNQEKS